MNTELAYASIVYLALFRLSIIAVGAMSVFLGYRLFIHGFSGEGSGSGTELEATLGSNTFALKNAAPGTFFALFGVLVISVMLINAPAEITYSKGQDGQLAAPDSAEPHTLDTTAQTESEQWVLRGVDGDESSKALGVFLNNYAWDLAEDNKLKQAIVYARLAEHMDSQNAQIVNSLAELLYKNTQFKPALNYKLKAVDLDKALAVDLNRYQNAL